MKNIREMAHVVHTDSRHFVDCVNSWVLAHQNKGYAVEITYTSTTPYGGKTEYQAFLVARSKQ